MESVRQALTSPRRIFLAMALASLLVGSSIGMLGYANAADQPPPIWQIPASHIGDTAQYERTSTATGTMAVSAERTYRWQPAQAIRALNGTSYDAAQLERIERRVDDEGVSSFWTHHYDIALDGEQPLRRDWQHASARGASSFGVDPLAFQESREQAQFAVVYTHELSAPCGFAPPFQFKPTRLDVPLPLPGCGGGPFGHRVVSVKGQERVVFQNQAGTIEITYAPSLPVPEKLVFNEFGQRTVWEIRGFERGDTPYPDPGNPKQMSRPLATLASTTRWGPDDADFAPAYTRTDAFEDAKLSGDDSIHHLDSFLARNPDWWMLSSSYTDAADENGRTWGWSFTLAGATETMGLLSYQRRDEASGPEPLFDEPEQRHLVHAFEPQEATDVPVMPPVMPTAGSAALVWADEANQPRDNATGWSFSLGCINACIFEGTFVAAGDGVLPSYRVGSSGNALYPILVPEEQSGDQSTLMLDAAGTVRGGSLVQWTVKQGPSAVAHQSEGDGGPVGIAPMPNGWVPPGVGVAAAASGLGLLVAALYYFWPAIKSGAFLGLRARRGGRDALDHPVRRALYDHIVGEPGIHYQALVRKANLGHGSADHHLRRLATAGLVAKVSEQGYTCYFPHGDRPRIIMGAAPALRAEGARVMYAAIEAQPGLSVAQLATTTGLSPGTVSHHLRRMREAHIVESIRDGRAVRLYIAASAAAS